MKEKERFISIDDSGESIFTFDEADMIIDTKTNIVYGANNVPDLVKILNYQSSQWQKLKEWLNDRMEHYNDCLNENVLISSERQEVLSARHNQCFETIAQMEYIEKELEGEDDL